MRWSDDRWWRARWWRVLGEGAVVADRCSRRGSDRACTTGGRSTMAPGPPGPAGWGGTWWTAFVEADEGTGIVHLAPAFGEVDRQVGRDRRPAHAQSGGARRSVHHRGVLVGGAGGSATPTGRSTIDWRRPGCWSGGSPHPHPYPHCWRCSTPLIYWGKPSWYVRTSDRKADLVAQNQTIGWHPEHIRDGRMGEWLANNVDWALSRDRYWGTPLPVWRCDEGHVRCVGSRSELSELSGADLSRRRSPPSDHRRGARSPARTAATARTTVDATGGAGDRRLVRFGIDADRPVGLPGAPGSAESLQYPADFICEAIDQTRGWFYSLLAVNTLVRGTTPYRNVLCLGHIVDADGRKMSKSVGNVIDPWEILTTRGADPLRWWMFSQGSPWTPTRVSFDVIDASMHDALLTLWNTWSFFTTYATLNGFDPADPAIPGPAERSMLDRWMLSRLHDTVARVTEHLDGYEPFPAATAIAELIGDTSNWYVRRSRRRFWRTDPGADPADSLGAQSTLFEVLVTLAPDHGPDDAVRGRPDVARPDRGRRIRLGAPGRLAGRPRPNWSTRVWRRGWRWPDGCRPSAGPPGPRPGSRSANRCPGPWSTSPLAARSRPPASWRTS